MATPSAPANARASEECPEVHDREHHHPDAVDEVPVPGYPLPRRVRYTPARRDEEPGDRDEPDEHVQAVQSGECEEGRAEHAGAWRDPAAEQPQVLEPLTGDEDQAERRGDREPDARAAALGDGHGRARGEEEHAEHRGAWHV